MSRQRIWFESITFEGESIMSQKSASERKLGTFFFGAFLDVHFVNTSASFYFPFATASK
jgi:hypothetical protein